MTDALLNGYVEEGKFEYLVWYGLEMGFIYDLAIANSRTAAFDLILSNKRTLLEFMNAFWIKLRDKIDTLDGNDLRLILRTQLADSKFFWTHRVCPYFNNSNTTAEGVCRLLSIQWGLNHDRYNNGLGRLRHNATEFYCEVQRIMQSPDALALCSNNWTSALRANVQHTYGSNGFIIGTPPAQPHQGGSSQPTKCAYCKIRGHTKDECYKKKRKEQRDKSGGAVTDNAPIRRRKPKKKCNICKSKRHATKDCPRNSKKEELDDDGHDHQQPAATPRTTNNRSSERRGEPGKKFYNVHPGGRITVYPKWLNKETCTFWQKNTCDYAHNAFKCRFLHMCEKCKSTNHITAKCQDTQDSSPTGPVPAA